MVSTLLIETLIAKGFSYLGAIHSFISINLACKLSKPKEELEQILVINTPLGKVLPTTDGVKKGKIRISECDTKMDLVVLEMEDYDVILEMDWLLKYHAYVDYYHKMMTFSSRTKHYTGFKESRC